VSAAKPKVAFVIQRYGEDITGGSESHCRQVVERLLPWFDIEVLTSCGRDHLTWRNDYPAGVSEINGVLVRRFPSKSTRDLLHFHELYDQIFQRQLSRAEEFELIRRQGPDVPDLVDYVKANHSRYDAFVCFTYLYYPVVHTLPLVARKAIFVPTAHDEASLYVHLLDELFHATPYIFFNTEEEKHLLQKRFVLPERVGRVVGMGFEPPQPGGSATADWESLQASIAGKRLFTYVGRVENGKGCDELVDYFQRFKRQHDRDGDLTLLLLGRRTLPLPPDSSIVSPGYVSEYAKVQAVSRSTIAVAPSPLESLCMAAMEAWMAGIPVLANGKSPVLVGHCLRSNGGLWYSSYEEFCEALKMLLRDENLRAQLGAMGRLYVEQNYRWDSVIAAYREVLNEIIMKAKNES